MKAVYQNQKLGFSLIEFLIALVIFSLAALGLANGLAISINAWKSVTDRKNRYIEIQYLERQLQFLAENYYIDAKIEKMENTDEIQLNTRYQLIVEQNGGQQELILMDDEAGPILL